MSKRRLAAIMFTDIVGYTSLMGSDEDKAFQVLRQNREIQQSSIKKYHGEWLKEMGDGILAQFSSATDSVQCAIEIQRQARKDLEAQIRIGIHLGDITFENNDVFGDGVNIASRLQSITDPGGIYLSESIHNAIRSQRDIESKYLGEVKLKNVNYPFKTYFIKEKGLPVPSKNRIIELTGSGRDKSIVILPFDNYTGSDELEYFVAGMHSSMIGAIGTVSGMRVISKTTSNAYKDSEKSIPEIASELGVDTIIEASVLGLGEKISLQVKLMDAYPEEKLLWMHDYYEDKSQILNLYSKITKQIANDLMLELTPREEQLLARSLTIDEAAYDSYLKGLYLLEDADLESLNKAREYLNSAIEKNPDWAPLYSSLAQVWGTIVQMGFESPEIGGPKIFENLNKALELDPNSADSHFVIGMTAFLTEWDWEKAEMELLKALAANPNDAMSRVIYAHLLGCLQRPDESLTQGRLAIELDPLNPLIQVFYAAPLMNTGDYETALAYGEKISAVDPGHFMANSLIEVSAFLCRDYNKVMEAAKYIFAAKEEEVDFKEVERIFGETGFVTAYEEILRQLEVLAQKGYTAPVEMAFRYMMVDQPDKAMEWIEKGFEVRDQVMPYIATHIFLCEPLFDNPRFLEIVKKMNLPLP